MIKINVNQNYELMQEKFPCKGNEIPCVICGKPCSNPKFYIWCHLGGNFAVTAEEGELLNAEGKNNMDLGSHPIGTDCLRKHPELKPYSQKSK